MEKNNKISKLELRNANPGRKDGAYTRIFGNEDLGAFISEIHATAISSGNILETLIMRELSKENKIHKDFKCFSDLSGILKEGEFVFLKVKTLEENGLILEIDNKKKKLDFYAIKKTKLGLDLFIIELKAGDTFDTKKAAKELELLKDHKKFYKEKQIFNKITPMFVSFYQIDISKIYKGLKLNKNNKKDNSLIELCYTGETFCDMFKIRRDNIIKFAENVEKKNEKYFFKKILELINK